MSFEVIHNAALIWYEHQDKMSLAQAMLTGYQYEVEQTKLICEAEKVNFSASQIRAPRLY